MDYAEVGTQGDQVIELDWEKILFNKEIRDSAGLHYKDGTFSLAGRRFEFNLNLSTLASVSARLSVRAVVLNAENKIVQSYPETSFKVGPGSLSAVSTSLVGYCPKDCRVQLQARGYGAPSKIAPFTVVRSWV